MVTSSSSLDLQTDANLSGGRVFFSSRHHLLECIVNRDNYATDIHLIYTWKKYRGYFRVTSAGVYSVECKGGVRGSISISDTLWQKVTTPPPYDAATDNPREHRIFDGTVPTTWDFLNIYVRPVTDIGRFVAFYENGIYRENISRLDALEFIATANYTHEQIHIEHVHTRTSPGVGGGGGGGGDDISKHPTPLLDGTMGWMKSMNFSAHHRLCGRGANVHFYDDGYHLQHEDLQNPRICVRTQIDECARYERMCDHGTASLGILAATKNHFGIAGLMRCADTINLYSYGSPMHDVLHYAQPGDIYGLNVQYCVDEACSRMFPLACVYPDIAYEYYRNGIILVQAAGNSHLDLNTFEMCRNQSGPPYGFVVSATLRDSDVKRDLGLSDTGIGWYTNYNHDNSLVNNWGERVVTTYAHTGDVYFGGRNRGYGSFGGTSSATPLITGVFGIWQGFVRTRCPHMFLSFTNFVEILEETGATQHRQARMGYTPDIQTALLYIEKNFLPRCSVPQQSPTTNDYEPLVTGYDDLIDYWEVIPEEEEDAAAVNCNNSVNIDTLTNFLHENDLIKVHHQHKFIICQTDVTWRFNVFYLPAITSYHIQHVSTLTIIFMRESKMKKFRIAKTFGLGTWDLEYKQKLTFQLLPPRGVCIFN